ncbi:MAG: exodeoxyribonuclease VII small subunit [Planctomycetes bacterium]|nr:exodeoxyribonuclease VII small subunit [Planctomycetota bacterium]
MAKEKEKMSFEQALARLEQIVRQIEEGKVPLEESIEKYAEGIELVKCCRSILDTAERKIQVLAKGQGQSLAPAGELDESADQSS